MKVLMIAAYPLEPGVVNGGIESVTSTLVPALAERDEVDSVTVLRFHHGEATTDYRREGPKVEVYYLRGQDRLRTLTGSFLDVRKAKAVVARLDPDVVHGQEIGWIGDIATRCSPRSVVTVHGLPHVEIRLSASDSLRDKLRIRPIELMVGRVLRRARVVISISNYDRRKLCGLIHGTTVSIANPTAPEFFSLAPSVLTAPQLLFAGVLSPRKDVVGLVNAFARAQQSVPAARLVIVGPQPDQGYARNVQERVTALGLDRSVDMVGLVDNDRLRDELASARAVVMFSREETAPTIIAQAMAAGKPVVASRVGGIPELVADGESGFLVDPQDEDALALRMKRLLDDQELCLRMGSCGYARALQRFAPDTVAARTVEAYRAAIDACPRDLSLTS
jgi:glycosyltransferase involved in cell wall biosynthesis